MRLVGPDWVRGMVALTDGDLDAAAGDFEATLAFGGHTAGPRFSPTAPPGWPGSTPHGAGSGRP